MVLAAWSGCPRSLTSSFLRAQLWYLKVLQGCYKKFNKYNKTFQVKVDVTHDTRLVDTDFTIEQNLVEAPRSSGSGDDDTNINNIKGKLYNLTTKY